MTRGSAANHPDSHVNRSGGLEEDCGSELVGKVLIGNKSFELSEVFPHTTAIGLLRFDNYKIGAISGTCRLRSSVYDDVRNTVLASVSSVATEGPTML